MGRSVHGHHERGDVWRAEDGRPREALAIYRSLDRDNPAAFDPDLAASLNNYAIWLDSFWDAKAAASARREAIETERTSGGH